MGNAGEIMENNIEELYKAIKAVGELAGNQVTDDDIKEKLYEPWAPCADNEKALEHLKNGVEIFFESINEKYKSEEKGKYLTLTDEQFKAKVGKLVMFAADEIVAENIDSTIPVPRYIWILDNWNPNKTNIMTSLNSCQSDLTDVLKVKEVKK